MANIPHLLRFIFTLLFLGTSNSYYVDSIELRDLQSTDANFITEANAWTADGLVNAGIQHSICGSTYLLGGYDVLPKNKYFSMDYAGLPATHTMFTFTIEFWLIDSWNDDDYVLIEFDGTPFQAFIDIDYQDFPNTDLCGANTDDLGKVVVTGKVMHSLTTLTVKVTNKMDNVPTDESWGFRDLRLVFGTANGTDTNSFCSDAAANFRFPDEDCTCSTGKYPLYNPGQCANCDNACKSCYWGSSSDCWSCKDGYYLSGNDCLPCDSYCSKCTGPTADECSACHNPYYLVLGQSCVNGCTSPMIPSGSGSNRVCSYSCTASQYIYPDGTCHTNCGQYLRPTRKSGVKFCEYYCGSSQYYDALSDTCVTTCPSGYYEDSTYRYCIVCQTNLCAKCPTLSGAKCDECKSGAILDENSVCRICDSMDVDHIKSTTTGDRFKVKLSPSTCILDLDFVTQNLLATDEAKTLFPAFTFTIEKIDSTSYYLNIDFTSSVLEARGMDLELSYLTGIAEISKTLVPSEALQSLADAAPTAAATLGGTLGAGLGGAISLGATAALWSLVGFQQFIGYFIYINIDYPFQVELFLSLLQSTSLDFLPNPLESITDYFDSEYSNFKSDVDAERYQPPKKFVKLDGTSFFVENGGSTIAIGLGFLFLMAIIPPLLRIRVLWGRSLLSKVLTALRWNVVARTFLESGIPLSLAVFLQCRKVSFSTLYSTFSVLMAFIAFCYMVGMFHYLFKRVQYTGNYFLELKRTRDSFGTLYEGMSLKRAGAKYYHLIILLRGVLLMFLITFLESVPMLQIVPLIFYNAGLVYYLFKKAEFEDSKLNAINRLKEILILIGEVGILCLSFNGGSEDYYNAVGWLIVGVLCTALFIELGYTIGVQIMLLAQLPKKFRQWRELARLVINKEAAKKAKEKMKSLTSERI